MIEIACWNCEATGSVPEEFQGRRVRCPKCDCLITIPNLDEFDEEPAPSRRRSHPLRIPQDQPVALVIEDESYWQEPEEEE